ncbi:uncharacterized protein LOC102155734 isoform X6 [Canis lupus familiaris]|uniref:uncharacterized protein LOC102155734 isoform X6 n=1 Tax=Canis lupus familiaris TaxID=9615 RepID=UPI0018F41EA2|nr:uncharacterized protein LOC102155734 isoform X6 [Canis lupus familiaris]
MASPVGWAARWGRAVSDQDPAAPWPVHAEPGPSPGQRALCLSCPIHPELPGHRAGAGRAPTLRGQAHGQASSWCGKAPGLVCDSASAPGGAQAPEVRRSPCVTLRETPACGTAQHATPHPLRCYQESLTGLKPHKVHSPKRTFTHLT